VRYGALWKDEVGIAGEVRQGSEGKDKVGRVEVRCGRRGKDGVNRRGGRVEAKQAWLGVVWCGGSGRIRQGSAGTAIGMAGSVTAGIGEYRQEWRV